MATDAGMLGLLVFDSSEDALVLLVCTPDGELAWTESWSAEEIDDANLSTDGTNFAVVFVVGIAFEPVEVHRYLVFDPGGAEQASGTGSHRGFEVSVELAGDAIFVGTGESVPSGDGLSQTTGARVVAYRSGQEGSVWSWTRPGTGMSTVQAITPHPSGTVFVAGSQGGSTDDPQWVTRLSGAGAEMWSGEFPSQGAITGLVVLPSGDVALVRQETVTTFDVEGVPLETTVLPDNVGSALFDARDGDFLLQGTSPLGNLAVGLDVMGNIEFEVRDETFQPTGAAWLGDDVVLAGLSMDRDSLRVTRMQVPGQ